VDIVGSHRNRPQLSTRHDDDDDDSGTSSKCSDQRCYGDVGMVCYKYAAVERCMFSFCQKLDRELALQMSFGREFQTLAAAANSKNLTSSALFQDSNKT